MGMSASQARLLSITARLTDNENSGQAVSYSKQRLADQTQQVNAEYNEALSATKLTVLTGFNGSEAIYKDISYGLMTGMQMFEESKQYVVTDTMGRIMVTAKIADAYKDCNGDFNRFLKALGYSQSDLTIRYDENDNSEDTNQQAAAEKVHQAWDKYFESIGVDLDLETNDSDGHEIDKEEGLYTQFGWTDVYEKDTNKYLYGYAHYSEKGKEVPINYEGTTQAQRELYDYAAAITEAYLSTHYDVNNYKNASDADNVSAIAYYKNLFYKMQSSGYFAYTNQASLALDGTGNYKYVRDEKSSPEKDRSTFEEMLRKGELLLEYYSTSKKTFVSTSISDDESIEEVKDEQKIAAAETKYTQDLDDLERKDKKLDLELKKLDTEHSALQTEYDSVKNIIDKNVEKSFNTFG